MTDVEQIHNKENLRKSWTDIAANIMAQAQLEEKVMLCALLLKSVKQFKVQGFI